MTQLSKLLAWPPPRWFWAFFIKGGGEGFLESRVSLCPQDSRFSAASSSRRCVFINERVQAVESRSADLGFDLRYESALAAYSASEYFEDDERKKYMVKSAAKP